MNYCKTCIHLKSGKCVNKSSAYWACKRKKSDLACKQYEG